MMNLRYFTQPDILLKIGCRRLATLLEPFSEQLKPLNLPPPPPPGEEDDIYPPALAAALAATPALPSAFAKTLRTIEALAAPENRDRLHEISLRRLPNLSPSIDCPFERALDLWLWAPEELAPFGPPETALPAAVPADSAICHDTISHEPPATLDAATLHAPTTSVAPPAAPPAFLDHPYTSPASSSLHPPTLHASHPPTPDKKPHIILPPEWSIHVEPSTEPVNGAALLDQLRSVLTRFVVLASWLPETIALWILHTYAFELRDVTSYLGIESPLKRCGKTTLLNILSRLVNRPVVAANVSSPALFRAVQELRPTLMIDEADTFLRSKDQLEGILNSAYTRATAYVVRVGQQQASDSKTQNHSVAFFSSWCPKAFSLIGRLPDTLADRCIIIPMQRKTAAEQCERLRNLDGTPLRRQCARFVLDHSQAITAARPQFPPELNDRAADIWEPLLALADLAGGQWPELARHAAVALSNGANDNTPVSSLLLDIFILFSATGRDRMFTRELLEGLNTMFTARPWMETRNGKRATEIWLAQQLRPFGIVPRTVRLHDLTAKGYFKEDFVEVCRRYASTTDLQALLSQPINSHPASPPPQQTPSTETSATPAANEPPQPPPSDSPQHEPSPAPGTPAAP